MRLRRIWIQGAPFLAFGLALLIFSRVSFVLAAAYHEGGVLTTAPITDAQRVSAAKEKILRALNDPRSAQFGDIFVSRVAGSPAICGAVTSNDGRTEPQARRFVVKDGYMFFDQTNGSPDAMWMMACSH